MLLWFHYCVVPALLFPLWCRRVEGVRANVWKSASFPTYLRAAKRKKVWWLSNLTHVTSRLNLFGLACLFGLIWCTFVAPYHSPTNIPTPDRISYDIVRNIGSVRSRPSNGTWWGISFGGKISKPNSCRYSVNRLGIISLENIFRLCQHFGPLSSKWNYV